MSQNFDNLPKWNLDSIFPSIESDSYKKAVEEYKAGLDKLNLLLNDSDKHTSFSNWLNEYLTTNERILATAKTLGAYSYIIYSVDTTNTKFLNNINKIEEIGIKYDQVNLRFQNYLKTNSEKLDAFYKEYPKFNEYKFVLNEMIEESDHRMSPAEEKLAADLQQTGGNAWDRLHEQLISNLKTSEGKTFNELRNDAYSADPLTRKKSYFEEISLLKQNEISFAACLNNLKGETQTLNQKRKWNEALDRALFSSRMNKKSLDAMISVIEESLPIWREYLKLKSKFLKKNKMTADTSSEEGIAFYDLFAPLSTNSDNHKWTFEEAKNYIIQQYSTFSSEMGNFAKNAFEKNWIDAEIRKGKVGGAYDEDFALNHESRILTNFTGSYSDVITLAHELGHAYHFHCLKGKDSIFFNYPMTLAETASTFAETIVKQDMLKQASKDQKIMLLDADLQDVTQVLVDILCRFYFEKSVFESKKNGELNSDDFCRLMIEAQEKTYGNGLNNNRHEFMWAVKSHYYSTSLDFYNFPYAFGQLFAAGLYSLYIKEGVSFSDRYKYILSLSGSMSCEELCKNAGFDISNKEFWNLGIEMYKKEIIELKKLFE